MNILVVDDESFIRDMLEYILRNFNGRTNRVVTVATGNEALNVIRSNVFDICFLDVILPDMSGLRIMDRIKATTDNTKIVIMTGSFITEEMHTQIKSDADIFIEKPFSLSTIEEIISNVVIKTTGQQSG
jgi:DNA-binding NtrC family response regulator